MQNIQMKRYPIPEEHRFFRYWVEKDLELSRVYAGLVPPGHNDGFICVLGESLSSNRHFYVIDEYESEDLGDLLTQMARIKEPLKIQQIFSPVLDDSFRAFLSHFNEKRASKGLHTLDLVHPYQFDNGRIYFPFNLLGDCTLYSSKQLYFLDSKVVKARLDGAPNKMNNETYHDHPAVAAAGWPLAAMKLDSYSAERKTPAFSEFEYPVFGRRKS